MFQLPASTVKRWCEAGWIEGAKSPGGEWQIMRAQFGAEPEEVRRLFATLTRINRRFDGEVDDYE